MGRAEFHGRYFDFAGVRAEPRPTQKPYPPLIFGGKSAYAFSRVARLAEGWYGYGLDLEATANCIAGLRAACAQHGRSFDEIEVSITPKGELDREAALRYADLGVHRLILPPRGRTVDEAVRAIDAAETAILSRV